MTPDPGTKWHDPALLDHLVRVRQPWDALVRRVVRAVLKRYLPDPSGALVEIGAGGGQLREWLPDDVAAAVTHTEPSGPFVRAFRERYPDATVIVADAASLPFDAGSVSGVLALCVLDTLPDLASVRAELARVLRPGGVVAHVLDLSTSPDALFPELIAGGELPLTNFARDPALLDVLTPAQRAALPAADDFDEVLAVRWGEFVPFVGMLARSNHPLAASADLGPFAKLHEPGGFDPERFALEFMAASADAARLLKLSRAMIGLFLAARQFGRPWTVRALSTRTHLRAKLSAAFGSDHGFAVEFAGPVRAWEPADRFTLRHAGRTVSRPLPVPGTPVEQLEGVPPAPLPADGVRATTVEVFVARRF
ncbi:class I SAM-dependent methyltransferase [Gemmata sp.]|uniref:class I SAM-dependent methyltransferase n=1 Tax=Gemmata sp. TaxID=1914242 RepID=UPI003F71F5D4